MSERKAMRILLAFLVYLCGVLLFLFFTACTVQVRPEVPPGMQCHAKPTPRGYEIVCETPKRCPR